MTEDELVRHCRARFRELIGLGARDGMAAMHRAVECLSETEARLLLTTALAFEAARVREMAAATFN